MWPWELLAYPLRDYPFPGLVSECLDVEDLADLSADLPRRTWQTDQQSPWHELFYEGFEFWRNIYRRFVRDVIAEQMTEPFYYQAVPTFRVHLPGNVAVGEFHTDAQYHHPAGEENFWLPLTDARDTSTVWVTDDDGIAWPVDACPGQMARFSAVSRRHGNKINETGRSRVSFDFRVLPTRLLPEEFALQQVTEHTKLPFAPGGYYAREIVTP